MKKSTRFLALLGIGLGAFSVNAAPTVWTFDNETVGQLPKGWKTELALNTNNPTPKYKVVSGTSGASGNTLSLADADLGGLVTGNYTATYTDSIQATDVEISVKFMNQGGLNNTGGLCWRVKDKDNYYCARASSGENNVGCYYVKAGTRYQISQGANQSVPVSANAWHTLKIIQKGNLMSVYLDDKAIVESKADDNITGSGSVGVWQKGVGSVSFDDFSVEKMDGTAIRPYGKMAHSQKSLPVDYSGLWVNPNGRVIPNKSINPLAAGIFFGIQGK